MSNKYLRSTSNGIYSSTGIIDNCEEYEKLKAGKVDWERRKKINMKKVSIPVELFYYLMKLDTDMTKCSLPDDLTIKPDGEHELDPCIYATKEVHKNVTVFVSECTQCGSVEITWERQNDTIDEYCEE